MDENRCMMCGKLLKSTKAKFCKNPTCRKRWQRMSVWLFAQPAEYQARILSADDPDDGFRQAFADWLARDGGRLGRAELRPLLKRLKRDLRRTNQAPGFTFDSPPVWARDSQGESQDVSVTPGGSELSTA